MAALFCNNTAARMDYCIIFKCMKSNKDGSTHISICFMSWEDVHTELLNTGTKLSQ